MPGPLAARAGPKISLCACPHRSAPVAGRKECTRSAKTINPSSPTIAAQKALPVVFFLLPLLVAEAFHSLQKHAWLVLSL